MKLTKIFLVIMALCALSCGKNEGLTPGGPNNPGGPSTDDNGIVWTESGHLAGQWSLTSYGQSVQPEIYIEFCEDETFNLYQRFTDIAWVHYNGNYTLKSNILTGKYSDGTSLANDYKVSYGKKGDLKYIRLKSDKDDAYIQIYEECEIPEYIVEEAKSGTKAVRSTDLAPIL